MCSFGSIIHKLFVLTLFVVFSLITSNESKIIDVSNWQDAIGGQALSFVGLVEKAGRKAVEYTVTTEDGYVLQLFRIPPNPLLRHKKKRLPVYFQHPFLCSADVFVLREPEANLPIILSDAGYDVWLGNTRGTVYGRRHLKLSTNDHRFWDYSLDDFALKDLPVNINFVLEATNSSSLSLIGMSLGTVTPKILLADQPEYNKKINVFINLASVAFLRDRNSCWDFFYVLYQTFFQFVSRQKPFELLPQNTLAYFFIKNFCLANENSKQACLWLMNIIVGEDYEESLEPSEVLTASHYLPAGTSTNIFLHFYQFLLNGTFNYFDHGDEKLNMMHYGQPTPPDYNISNIAVPMVFFHGRHDLFATPINYMPFISKLPTNRTLIYEVVNWTKFNHIDFISARNVRTLLFDRVVQILEDFNSVKK